MLDLTFELSIVKEDVSCIRGIKGFDSLDLDYGKEINEQIPSLRLQSWNLLCLNVFPL